MVNRTSIPIMSSHDACYRSTMARYHKWSARAAQATAKCRKAHGHTRKGEAGKSLRRWQREKWVDTRNGKPCGHKGDHEYCRPSKRVSKSTPHRGTAAQRRSNLRRKTQGKRAKRV
jgi:hypothetical protein